MLDPVTAASLVGTVVQFIDFGVRIVSSSSAVYKSTSGAADENIAVEVVTQDLETISTRLQNASTSGDPVLDQLLSNCNDCASQMLQKLDKLKVKSTGGKRKLESLGKAILTVWSKDELRGLQDRLVGFRQQLTLHITSDLRTQFSDVSLQQMSSLRDLDQESKNRTFAILSAIAHSEDGFKSCLNAQMAHDANLHDQTKAFISAEIDVSQNAIAQHITKSSDEVKVAMLDAEQNLADKVDGSALITIQTVEDEGESIREMIRQLEARIIQMEEERRAREADLQATITSFITSHDVKTKQRLKERSKALTSALVALQTLYDSLVMLLAAVKDNASAAIKKQMVRTIRTAPFWRPRESVSDMELAARKPVREIDMLLAYYSYYYCPVRVNFRRECFFPVRKPIAIRLKTGNAEPNVEFNGEDRDFCEQDSTCDLILADTFEGKKTFPNLWSQVGFIRNLVLLSAVFERFCGPEEASHRIMSYFCENVSSPRQFTEENVAGKRLKQDVRRWCRIAERTGIRKALSTVDFTPLPHGEHNSELDDLALIIYTYSDSSAGKISPLPWMTSFGKRLALAIASNVVDLAPINEEKDEERRETHHLPHYRRTRNHITIHPSAERECRHTDSA